MRIANILRHNNNKRFYSVKSLRSMTTEAQHAIHSGLVKFAKQTVIASVAGIFFLSPLVAMSDNAYKAYYGVGLGSTSGDGYRLNTYDFQAGYEFRPWMTFEAHLGTTNADTVTENNVEYDLQLDYYNSIQARFNMVARDYRAYAFLGFTTTSISVSGVDPVKRAGYAYGVGIDLFGNESTALYASFGRLIDRDIDDTETKFSQFLVGFRYYLRDNYNRSRIPERLQF